MTNAPYSYTPWARVGVYVASTTESHQSAHVGLDTHVDLPVGVVVVLQVNHVDMRKPTS